MAFRHRPQFELHLQRSGNRREAGRARARRPLCPRRLGAQGGAARTHHRAADRHDDGRASLGRPLSRSLGRRLRGSGRGGVDRAGIIEPALQSAEMARSASRPTAQLTAYDLYLRALADSLSYEKDKVARALELLAHARERDPHYGPARAWAAHCQKAFEVMSWTADPEGVRLTSINLARQALRYGPDEPDVLALAAFTLGYFGEDIDVAVG